MKTAGSSGLRILILLGMILSPLDYALAAHPVLDLIQAALKIDRTQDFLRHEREAADSSSDVTFGRLLPQINLDLSAGYGGGRQPSSSFSGVESTASLTLRQSLLNFSLYEEHSQRKAQMESSLEALKENRQEVSYEVLKAYITLINANRSLKLAREHFTLASSFKKAVDKRYKLGDTSREDVHQASAQRLLRKASVITSEQRVKEALIQIKHLTGKRIKNGLKPLSYEIDSDKLRKKLKEILVTHPTVRKAQSVIKVEDLNISLQRAKHIPTLDLYTSGDYSKTNLTTETTSYSFGLELRIPLFSGGSTSAQTSQAIARRSGAESLRDGELRRLKVRAEALLSQHDSSIQSIKVLENVRALAKKTVKALLIKLRAGTLTLSQVLLAEENLVENEITLDQLLSRFALQKIEILRTIGHLSPTQIKAILERGKLKL